MVDLDGDILHFKGLQVTILEFLKFYFDPLRLFLSLLTVWQNVVFHQGLNCLFLKMKNNIQRLK